MALSPLLDQFTKPRSVADATNPLLAIQNQPPGPTMFQQPYPAAEQAGPTVVRANASSFPAPPVRPQFGPPIPAGGIQPQLDYSQLDDAFPQGPTGPSGPAPSTPVQGNPFFNFLSALFGHSGGSPQQGMTGLLARGQGAPGTNQLGNPFNRFG
jgi:hypothetical protein